MPEERKHPIILAKDQHISTLILRHIHQQLSHSVRNHMLSKLRKDIRSLSYLVVAIADVLELR